MTKKPVRDGPDKIDEALKALLETPPAAAPSLLDQVAKHFALIEQLRERGHSYGRIAEALQAAGMEIAENTLRIYVGRLRRETTGALPKPARPRQTTAAGVKGKARVRQPVVGSGIVPAIGPETSKASEVPTWLTDEPDERNI